MRADAPVPPSFTTPHMPEMTVAMFSGCSSPWREFGSARVFHQMRPVPHAADGQAADRDGQLDRRHRHVALPDGQRRWCRLRTTSRARSAASSAWKAGSPLFHPADRCRSSFQAQPCRHTARWCRCRCACRHCRNTRRRTSRWRDADRWCRAWRRICDNCRRMVAPPAQ